MHIYAGADDRTFILFSQKSDLIKAGKYHIYVYTDTISN